MNFNGKLLTIKRIEEASKKTGVESGLDGWCNCPLGVIMLAEGVIDSDGLRSIDDDHPTLGSQKIIATTTSSDFGKVVAFTDGFDHFDSVKDSGQKAAFDLGVEARERFIG